MPLYPLPRHIPISTMAPDQWLCHRRHSSSLTTKCLLTLLAFTSLTVCTATPTASSDSSEQVSVRGVVGNSASLPCYIDEKNCGDIYFLTWSKREQTTDGSESWSRIYVYSDDNVDKPLSTLAGRARFEMKNNERKEARLVVNALRPGDEALYKCDVTYVAGKCPSLTFVQLQIIAKPLRSWIEHEGESLASGQRLSLSEGDHLKLQCSVLGGRPVPTIRWFSVDSRGRRTMLKSSLEATAGVDLLTSTVPSTNHDTIATTSLVLSKQVSRNDLGSRFECGIEHESIESNSLDTSVALDINVGIKTMKIIGPSTSVREGDRALVECVAYGSKPAAAIVWRNGSRIIDSGRDAKTIEEKNTDGFTVNTRSSLEIIVSHHDHLNPIFCEAANVAMRAPINKSTEISVLFAPQVVMQPSNGIAVNESTPSVSIYCTYQANPSVLLINETVWFKDGHVIDFGAPTNRDNRFVSTFAEYPILTIQNVSKSDTGNYYCSMANQLGAGRPANPVFLNVLYPPRVRLTVHPTPTPGFNIKEGDNLRMVCDIVDGNPRRATKMRWLKNGGETISELDSDAQSQKELTWMSVARSSTGNYTCQAVSEAGLSEPSNTVPIVIDYPPGKTIIRMLDESYAVKDGKLRLECIAHDLGSPSHDTEYHWDSDGVLFDTRTSILSISRVRLVNRANISCAAINSVGAGPRSMFEVTPYAPPKFINALPPSIGLNEHYSADKSSDSEGLSVYCRVECFPLCSIAWLRNGEPIDNRTGEFEITNSVLPEEFLLNRFESAVSTLTWRANNIPQGLDRVRDSGVVFSCVSSGNIVGPGVRSDTRFQVEYAPEKLRVSSSRVDVIEGETLPDLRCDADALPAATYRWISDSFYDKFSGVIAEGPVLTLNRSITRDSAGTYTCLAANRHGERRIDLQINVLFPPSCTVYESRAPNHASNSVGANMNGKNVALICEASHANPMSHLEFIWSLNGTHLNDSYIQQISHIEDNKSRIVIPAAVEELFGTWTCSIRNTVGTSDPNCTLFVDAPLLTPEWSALNDESILVISAVIVAIIFAFVFVILFTIFMMKRRRSVKNEKEKRENPDGDRSPTPSSSTSRLSSAPNDLISTKSQVSSKKHDGSNGLMAGSGGLCVTDTEHLSSSNSSSVLSGQGGVLSPSGELCFDSSATLILPHLQRKNDLYYAQHHPGQHHHPTIGAIHQSSIHSQSPLPNSTYDLVTKNDFRRTQSARFTPGQTLGNGGNIYSICEDNTSSMIYADLEMPNLEPGQNKPLPPVPAPKPKLTNTLASHHVYHNQHFPTNFASLSGTLGRNSTLSHVGHQQLIGSNSSNSSTPPSMSTTSTTNNSNPNGLLSNHFITQYQAGAHLQPTYDRPDSVNKPYYAARVQTSSSSNNSTSSSSYDDRNSTRPIHSMGTAGRNGTYQMGASDQFVGPQSFWEGYSRRPLRAKTNLRNSDRF